MQHYLYSSSVVVLKTIQHGVVGGRTRGSGAARPLGLTPVLHTVSGTFDPRILKGWENRWNFNFQDSLLEACRMLTQIPRGDFVGIHLFCLTVTDCEHIMIILHVVNDYSRLCNFGGGFHYSLCSIIVGP
jgi:hypothetical protein